MSKPTPEFVLFVLDNMRRTTPVTAKSMFGGWGIYADGLMVGLIADEVLYFKVDASTRAEFAAAGLTPFVYSGKGKAIEMSYWRVPDSALEAPHELADWMRLAQAAARRAAAKKPSSRSIVGPA
jgi:DNA transformation protein and related proteins